MNYKKIFLEKDLSTDPVYSFLSVLDKHIDNYHEKQLYDALGLDIGDKELSDYISKISIDTSLKKLHVEGLKISLDERSNCICTPEGLIKMNYLGYDELKELSTKDDKYVTEFIENRLDGIKYL